MLERRQVHQFVPGLLLRVSTNLFVFIFVLFKKAMLKTSENHSLGMVFADVHLARMVNSVRPLQKGVSATRVCTVANVRTSDPAWIAVAPPTSPESVVSMNSTRVRRTSARTEPPVWTTAPDTRAFARQDSPDETAKRTWSIVRRIRARPPLRASTLPINSIASVRSTWPEMIAEKVRLLIAIVDGGWINREWTKESRITCSYTSGLRFEFPRSQLQFGVALCTV